MLDDRLPDNWNEKAFQERFGQAQKCNNCNNEIEGDLYEDSEHDYLCEDCLKFLHKSR